MVLNYEPINWLIVFLTAYYIAIYFSDKQNIYMFTEQMRFAGRFNYILPHKK